MVSQTNEQALEASIEKHLTGTCLEEQRGIREQVPFSRHHGYRLGQASDFNARYAVDTRFLWQFLETTQAEELARLKDRYDNWQTQILDRFDKLAKKYGSLHLLKRGLDIEDVHLHLMYPAPLTSSSDRVKQSFEENIFSSTRQVRYSMTNTLEEIDIVLFLNGLPFATLDGYRFRASYKLLEINDKDRLIQPTMLVVDLGSAPGGWSQVASKLVGHKGRVVASDILPMDAIAGVEFIQGDFTEQGAFDQIMATLDGAQADVVISDMAPNISGVNAADQAASMYLLELALDMACQVLKPKGSFVAKVFHGEGYDEYVKAVRQAFDKVVVRKPDSSSARSREVYLVAKGFRGA